MRTFLSRFLLAAGLLATAAAARAQYYVDPPNPAATYLIGGLGFEQLLNDGFAYNYDFTEVLGSVPGLYTDTTLLGDPSNVFPAPFVPKVRAYWDGSHLSSAWLGEDGLNSPGSIGGFPNTSATGETIATTRRLSVADPYLYNKNLDTEGIYQFANPNTQVDRALILNLASGHKVSFVLDGTGYALGTIKFSAFMQAGTGTTINWSYSLDGSTLVSAGVSTAVSGSVPVAYTADLGALSGVLANDGDLVIVATFTGANGAQVVLDNFQFIGLKAGSSTPDSPATIAGLPPGTATVGTAYSHTFTVGGSPAPTLSVTSGALPPGLALSSSAGTLAGTPTAAGNYPGITVTAHNSAGDATLTFGLAVSGPATLSGAPPAGVVGTVFSHTFSAGGYPAPTSVTLQSGTLPPGLALSGLALSGTPTASGSYSYTVRATNSLGSADLAVTQAINAVPTIAAPASLTAVRGSAYTGTFTLGGYPAPTSVTLQSGALPAGLVLGGATISGTPTVAGSFPLTVAATNAAGTTTRSVTLDVQARPALTLPSGGALTFSTLTPASADIVAEGLPAPAVTATGLPAWLTLTSVTDAAAGRTTATISGTPPIGAAASYSLVFHATNAAGTAPDQTLALSIVATTSAPVITAQPAGGNVALNGSFTFSVTATGVPTPTYQWRRNGTALAGATAASLVVSNAQAADAGDYSVVVTNNTGAVTSTAATLVVLVPVTITTPPASTAVGAGEPVNLSVVATGLAPLTYQWRKNGTPISGATAATFAIASATLADTGDYTVVVTNPAGAVTSAVARVAIDSPPVIVTPPAGGTFTAGTATTLSVVATSQSALTYQWRRNGAPLAGADADVLTLASPGEADSGAYDVVVTNARGSVTSAAATLVFVAAPAFTAQPASVLVVVGQAAHFEVAATPAGLEYQWLRDGVTIEGATTPQLTVFDIDAAKARAAFTCRIGNLAGSSVSSPAFAVAYAPASRVVPLTGGSYTLEVFAPPAYAGWSAAADVGWLAPQRNGDAVNYTVPNSPGGQPRTGKITVTVPGLGLAVHEVAQQEFVVLNGDFSSGVGAPGSAWETLGTGATAVVDNVGGRSAVIGLGPLGSPNDGASAPAAAAFAAVRSRAALVAQPDRRVQTDVFLAVDSAGAGQAEAFLALIDPAGGSAPAADSEPASGLRVALWHAGPAAEARLRGRTWLTARFKAADGKYRSLNLATALPADDLANRWVRLTADISADRRLSVWADPEPFGDPVRVWTSTTTVSPALLGPQALLLGLRGESPANRPYQSSPVVSGGFAPRAASNRIVGLSTRTWTGAGEQVAIAGFVTSGGEAQLLVRGLGPMLTRFGVPGTLAAPRLVGYDGRTPAYIVRVQDAWEMQRSVETVEAISAAEKSLGLFPLSAAAADAAFLYYPRGGAADQAMRTVHLKSADGAGTGQALLELYATNRTSGGELVALSTRAQVPKDVAMVSGVALDGNATRLFLVRGVGPALAAHGIAAPLAATRLDVFRGERPLLQNSGWGSAASASLLPAAATVTGAFALPAGGGDSALLLRLPPGAFTVPVTAAAAGGAGVALAEIYALPLDAELDTVTE